MLSLFATSTIELFNKVSTISKWFIFRVVPVLVKSVIKSATPINGAASVDPLNLTTLRFRLFSARYFFVNVGNSVATVISSVMSATDFMFESSGAAKTRFVFPNFKSSSWTTSASFSSIRSIPVIPISAIPSWTNSGISDALANKTSISLLKVLEINLRLSLSFNPNPAFSNMFIEGSLILPFEGTAILIFIVIFPIFLF